MAKQNPWQQYIEMQKQTASVRAHAAFMERQLVKANQLWRAQKDACKAHHWRQTAEGRHGSDKGVRYYECTLCGQEKEEY